eukprot:338261-Amphidinium_carterae.3
MKLKHMISIHDNTTAGELASPHATCVTGCVVTAEHALRLRQDCADCRSIRWTSRGTPFTYLDSRSTACSPALQGLLMNLAISLARKLKSGRSTLK